MSGRAVARSSAPAAARLDRRPSPPAARAVAAPPRANVVTLLSARPRRDIARPACSLDAGRLVLAPRRPARAPAPLGSPAALVCTPDSARRGTGAGASPRGCWLLRALPAADAGGARAATAAAVGPSPSCSRASERPASAVARASGWSSCAAAGSDARMRPTSDPWAGSAPARRSGGVVQPARWAARGSRGLVLAAAAPASALATEPAAAAASPAERVSPARAERPALASLAAQSCSCCPEGAPLRSGAASAAAGDADAARLLAASNMAREAVGCAGGATPCTCPAGRGNGRELTTRPGDSRRGAAAATAGGAPGGSPRLSRAVCCGGGLAERYCGGDRADPAATGSLPRLSAATVHVVCPIWSSPTALSAAGRSDSSTADRLPSPSAGNHTVTTSSVFFAARLPRMPRSMRPTP